MAQSNMSADSVDGVVPARLAEPDSAEAVSLLLQRASEENLAVFVKGAGTKVGWGPPPSRIDVLLSTARLNRVIAHRHGDLTATVQAGASLAAVNQELAKHRQWIPLDPPFADRATIGGIVATNDSGPRRHRYGAPRDLIIGMQFVRGDGCQAKGGGIVVKNVAGYDLPRLMTGSFGSLSVIVTATFKLFPITTASRTLVVQLQQAGGTAALGALVTKLLGSHLTPTAIEFETNPLRLLIRFESVEAAVAQQTANAAKLIAESGLTCAAVAAEDEERVWRQHGQAVWQGDAAVFKVTLLPTQLAGVLEKLEAMPDRPGYVASGRAGLGVFLVGVSGDTAAQARVLTSLRGEFAHGQGSATIVRGSRELRMQADVWGPIGDGLKVMRALKQQFDPRGILNAGKGPGNI